MHSKLLGIILTSAFFVTGCASVPLGTPAPTASTVQAIQSAAIPPVTVGAFKPSSTLKPTADKSMSARGATVQSPFEKSFSAYLGEVLKANLAAAGGLNSASATTITGELTRNELNAGGISRNNSVLAARFYVRRDNQVIYEQLQTVEQEWESSFMGAVAIPRAINEYGDMYRRLIEKLFADPAFTKACKAP